MRKNRVSRRLRNVLTTGILAVILACFGLTPQALQLFSADGQASDHEAFAADGPTEYTIFIYSGKEGYFGEPGNTVKKIEGNTYDEEVTVNLADLKLKVKNPDEYYVRGLKIAGHDNDELSSVQMKSYTFNIKEDTAFSVSYGIMGGMVEYTVNYRDGSGNTLHNSETFYGMPGDRPVLTFRHVEGYLPDEINLTKVLTDNAASNVFTFTYHRVYAGSGTDEEGAANDGNAGANNAAANAAAGNGVQNANAGNTIPGTNITSLDDNEPPLASVDKDKDGGISGATMGLIGIVIAGILIALALLYFILRRRGEEEE